MPRPRTIPQPCLTKEDMMYMDQELARQVLMEAVEEVPLHLHNRLVISPVFTVPKKGSDKRRGVINLKWVNSHVKYMKFKATTMRDVKAAVEQGCYMTTIDLKDAFWNVPVHPDDRRFLAFRWRGKVYQYRSLPFGLTSSPRILSRYSDRYWHHSIQWVSEYSSTWTILSSLARPKQSATQQPRWL